MLHDLQDTIAAMQASRLGIRISICNHCGAPTINGNQCPKCERETSPANNPS